MSRKPTYLGTLNAIALGAARGQQILTAWRTATKDEKLAGVLDFLAIREQEHAATFAKRIAELGYGVQEHSSEQFRRHLQVAGSELTDAEKLSELFGFGRHAPEKDPLLELFADTSIDATTGALLGRYIAEDRDSHRRLHREFERLTPTRSAGEEEPVLQELAERLDRLTDTLNELKSLRG